MPINSDRVNFFVVGAARSGTTSLYNYLSMHPKIFLPKVKECNYFSNVESLDPEVYKNPNKGKHYHMKIINSHEVYASLFSDAERESLKGDVSPSYLWDGNTAKRIYDYNPEAKIIISLRNPIHRAYSHYVMNFNTGYEHHKTFEEAISAKKNDIWGGGNMYLEMGLYYNQIKPYFDLFPIENIKILIYEDWIKTIENTMGDIFEFLGIENLKTYDLNVKHNQVVYLKNIEVINFFRQKKIKSVLNKFLSDEIKEKIKHNFFENRSHKEEMSPTTYHKLKPYYNLDISSLESLIDKNVSLHWK